MTPLEIIMRRAKRLDCLGAGNPLLRVVAHKDKELMDSAYSVCALNTDNVTPNGKINRNKANSALWDGFQRSVGALLKSILPLEKVAKIQYPANLRIRTSDAPKDRPFATTKIHSDVWVGEDPATCNVFINFGDSTNVGLAFYEPVVEVPAGKVADYDEHSHFPSVQYPVPFLENHIYFADSWCLHRTVNYQEGSRLSLDTRFVWKYRLESDGLEGGLDNYLTVDEYFEAIR